MGDVIHNHAMHRYELTEDGATAFASYVPNNDVWVFDHTVTPPALRGRGMAGRIVKAALADVRAAGKRIVPQCSYVAAYIERHPDERDLLAL